MGQHKSNPNCQLAKEGKLPPKPKKMGKRESERIIMANIMRITGLREIYDIALGGTKNERKRY